MNLQFHPRLIQTIAFASFGLVVLSSCVHQAPVESSEPKQPKAALTSSKETAAVEEERPQVIEIDAVETSGSFLAPMSRAVTSFGAAVTQDAFYLLGGYSGTPHSYSKEGQSSDVLKLDLQGKGGWQKVASLEQGLQGLAAIHHKGRLCHFGGNHASNPAGTDSNMNSVVSARCLDTTSGHWSELPKLPRGRSSFGAAVIDGKVYLAGGWTLNGTASSGDFVVDTLVLDLEDPKATWQSLKAPFTRRAVGVAAVGDKLVVVGGMTSDGNVSKEVDVYDTHEKLWSKGPEHPGDAFGIAVAGTKDALFAAGREGILRSFRPGETQWKEVRPLGFARFFHEMRVVGDELVVVGGIGDMHTRGRTRVVEKLPLAPEVTAFGQMTFQTPALAKNRQGILNWGEELYLFGGNLSLGQHDFKREHFTNEGWKLDLATLRFSEGKTFPLRRQSMQTIALDDHGLAVGGFGHEPLTASDSEALSQTEIFSYSFESETWTQAGSLPRGRTQFGLARSEGKLWIFGGLNYDPTRKDAFQHDQTIWISDEKKISFSDLDVTLPGPRRAFAGAQLDNVYYLIGGMKEGFQLVDDCLSFEFKTKEFSAIPCPAPRLSGDLIAAAGKLYLIGGSVKTDKGIDESRSVEVYDPKTKVWSKLEFEIPFSTRHMRALPLKDQILLISTHYDESKMTIGLLSP